MPINQTLEEFKIITTYVCSKFSTPMMLYAVLLFALLLPLTSGHKVYKARVDKLGASVVLNCTDDDVMAPGAQISYWLEPNDFSVLEPGESKNGMHVRISISRSLVVYINASSSSKISHSR